MAYQEMQGGGPPGKQSPLKDEMADPLERNSVHLQHMKALDTVHEFYTSRFYYHGAAPHMMVRCGRWLPN